MFISVLSRLKLIGLSSGLILVALMLVLPIVATANETTVGTKLRRTSIESGFTLWNADETFGVGVLPNGISKKKSDKLQTRLQVRKVLKPENYPAKGTIIGDIHAYKIGKGKAKRVKLEKKVWVTLSYPAAYSDSNLVLKYWNSTQQKWRPLPTNQNTDTMRVSAQIRHKYAVLAVFEKPKSTSLIGTGKASWYDGNGAANNEVPIGSTIRVTNLANGEYVDVVVSGTGPFVEGRIVDLSREDFDKIANLSTGVIEVKVELVEEN